MPVYKDDVIERLNGPVDMEHMDFVFKCIDDVFLSDRAVRDLVKITDAAYDKGKNYSFTFRFNTQFSEREKEHIRKLYVEKGWSSVTFNENTGRSSLDTFTPDVSTYIRITSSVI